MGLLRFVANVIWLVIAGLPLFLAYALAGVICCLLVVTIPFGIASFRLAGYTLWPFGKTIVERPDAGTTSVVLNVLWFVIAGWWLALGHLATAIALFVTIIGIPFAIASVQMAYLAIFPLGKDIVPVDEVRASYGRTYGVPAYGR